MSLDTLIVRLYEINAVKFGEFKLKSGIMSPVYMDLRVIVSFPDVLSMVAATMWEAVKNLPFDLICGVPYTALPIATAMSIQNHKPMVMRRKEKKEYGTGSVVEGVFQPNATVLIVEDVITSGSSIIETMEDLTKVGLAPKHAIVMVDREQGGAANIAAKGCSVISVLKLPAILEVLHKTGKINDEIKAKVLAFLKANDAVSVPSKPSAAPAPAPAPAPAVNPCFLQSYAERAGKSTNPVVKRLFQIMELKQTNLSFNPDVTKKADLLRLVDQVGSQICMVKTHIDVVDDFDMDLIKQLQALAVKHNFVIFEDRKFADIGNTAQLQFTSGVYRIAEWADIVNAHSISGPGIIDALREGAKAAKRDVGLLLLGEMSSKGNLATGTYTDATVNMATSNLDFVIGFIAQRCLTPAHPSLVCITPGVNLARSGDNLGQQFNSPEHVIGTQNSDIIQVGRGIFEAKDPAAEAKRYREAGWNAYLKRLSK